MKRPHLILKLWVVLLLGTAAALPGFAAQDISLLGQLKAIRPTLPLYRNGMLDYYIHCQELVPLGSNFDAKAPIIDAVRPHAEINAIANYKDPGIYPLYAPLEQLAVFWLQRSFSRGVLSADQAAIDKANRIVAGKGPVYLRSLLLDLDGKGFQADFNTRQAEVHHDVKIVLRYGSDGASLAPDCTGDLLKAASQLKAYSDSLTIDGAAGVIVLRGSVRIEEARATITADRMELELARNQDNTSDQTEDPGSLGSLKRIHFIGNVHVVRVQTPEEIADKGVEQLYADRMVYEVATTDLELTGSRPVLMQGKDFIRGDRILMNQKREEVRFFENVQIETRKIGDGGKTSKGKEDLPCTVTGNYAELDYPQNRAVISGKVTVDYPAEKAQLTCDRIDIYLADRDQKAAPEPKQIADANHSDLLQFSSSGGAKKVESLVCRKTVRLVRKTDDGEECATADSATYFPEEERILMQGKPQLSRNADSISGDEMEYFIAKEQLLVRNNSQVHLDSVRIDPKSRTLIKDPALRGDTHPLLVKSTRSDLNFGGNRLRFEENVDADNQVQKLTCDDLEIQLADASGAPRQNEANAVGSKKLIAAVCTGKVVGKDPQAKLFCDKLELAFGEKAVPGKTDLEKITATGNVKMESITKKKKSKKSKGKKKKVQDGSLFARNPDYKTTLIAQRGVIDLLTNIGDFYEKVRIFDPVNELDCEHLHLVGAFTEEEIPQIGSIRLSDETEFPERIGIGAGRELVQVIAHENVKLRRMVPATKEIQKVTGNHADYVIADRTVVLTGTPEKRPEMVATGGKVPGGMVGDKLTVFLDSEDVEVENGESLNKSGNFGF